MARPDPTPRNAPSASTGPSRYRLRGTFQDLNVSFPIPRRDALVGSDRSCDLELPVRGISRRHATLIWQGTDLVVSDLASKNGTYVNQERVQSATVKAGDAIRFGPVTLLLEPIEQDDAVLALTARPLTLAEEIDPTALWLEGGAGRPSGPWELIQQLLIALFDADPPELGRALRQAGAHLGADAGLLLERKGDGDALALATYGTLDCASLEDEVELLTAALPAGSGAYTRLAVDPRLACWALATVSGGGALVLRLGAAGGDDPRAFGDVLLRLVAEARHPTGKGTTKKTDVKAAPEVALGPGLVRSAAPAMQRVYGQIGQLRQALFPVLILGETGVGKEHLARLLHDSSLHARGPFVAINCAAIPAELLEAELFGIGRGIATGVSERTGKLREAHGGTLFLDEIGDMPLALQAKLLRALESGMVEPVGAAPVRIQVRFIAATNAALGDRIAAGQFRADLFYRLSGYQLAVPPLRERRADIAPLLEHFLGKACQQTSKRISGVTIKALRLLQQYDWPGNIRQLDNEARRLVVQCPDGQAIDSTLLPVEIQSAPATEVAAETPAELDLEQAVATLERRLIVKALEQAHSSRAAAAKLLGLSRNGLAAKMERLKIDVRSQVETAPGTGE